MAKIRNLTNKCCLCDDVATVVLHKTRRQIHALCQECSEQYLADQLDNVLNDLKRRRLSHNINCCGTVWGRGINPCRHQFSVLNFNLDQKHPLRAKLDVIKTYLVSWNAYICPVRHCLCIVSVWDGDDYELFCPECKQSWCSNCLAHPYHVGKNCLEHRLDIGDDADGAEIRKMIASGQMKCCPTCQTPTIRHGGCNKMTCGSCRHTWCWICQREDIDYDHYNPNNHQRCANRLWQE